MIIDKLERAANVICCLQVIECPSKNRRNISAPKPISGKRGRISGGIFLPQIRFQEIGAESPAVYFCPKIDFRKKGQKF
ncbi:MAG: hypothetical protein K6E91_08525 [Butyrivibrio sp.]|nr:hypothetical protein [Butyrivibrio sp.]